jgi:RNA polymerase primary sigma factor
VASSALTEYFRDVSRHEPMSREEELQVARRARNGDREALQRLVQANLRFVVSVAKRYRGRGLPLTDLVQAGNLGMVTAAMKFDPERGVKFISYAVWWIRQAIQSALAHQGRSVRLPMNRAAELARILRARQRLNERLGRDPTAAEIAEETGIRPDTVEMLSALHGGEVRLDVPIGDEERSTVGERLVVEEDMGVTADVEKRLMHDEIDAALETLRERDALVLRLYYGLGGERGRQLRDRALAELREGDCADALASFAA